MYNTTEDILQAIDIGFVVAVFLLNTGRALKAIDVCKECLIFLCNTVVKMEGEMFTLLDVSVYETIFQVICLMPDHTEALICGRKLLDIYCQCGKKEEEGNLTTLLANIYRQNYRYLEAMEVYKKVINITKEMGNRTNEAYANETIGSMSYHLGDHEKAYKYIKKALAIKINIGDKKGEASSYENLGTTVFKSRGEYDKPKEYLEKALAIRIQIGDKEGDRRSQLERKLRKCVYISWSILQS